MRNRGYLMWKTRRFKRVINETTTGYGGCYHGDYRPVQRLSNTALCTTSAQVFFRHKRKNRLLYVHVNRPIRFIIICTFVGPDERNN